MTDTTLDGGLETRRPLTIAHVLHIFKDYRYAVLLALAAVIFGYIAFVAAVLAFMPVQQTTMLNFRLNFAGADRKAYPNGQPFSSADIVDAPVLRKVFDQNQLGRYLSFDAFKASVFVIETNPGLERLAREYEARLADPRLSPVDRDRLEREYQEKKGSLAYAEFALAMVHTDRTLRVPASVMLKAISDILPAWAEHAERDRGVSRYNVEIVTANVLDPRSLQANEDFIFADVLRAKVHRILDTIDTLRKVPGADVLRLAPNNITLTDVRSNLEDTLRFRLSPILSSALALSASSHRTATMQYVESQLGYAQRQLDEARMRENALRSALSIYGQQGNDSTQAAQSQKGAPSPSIAGPTVTPQLGENFLTELSRLIARSEDVEYRQHMVDKLATLTTNEVAPLSQEVAYYQEEIAQLKTGNLSSANQGHEDIRAQCLAVLQDVDRAISQVTGIYALIYQNINNPSSLYTITSGARSSRERPISLRQLFLWGVLLFLAAIPLLIITVMLHHRIQEEERFEGAVHDARS